MEIAVVGEPEFTLGFQLAGINRLYNSNSIEESAEHLKELLNDKSVGIVVVNSELLSQLPERLKIRLSNSITPTVLGIGTEEDNTLRESIRKAIGVDLWK
ncbi:MAG: V-type ATP synthase subunit F [Euryarchaeota archaeon]|nr:V-type ATP synthase subunit F [Euryarchaeota archaeon]|tara:strand:+ start:3111 stop:3410 length:300 start_codon:yes stop_codon:yes gene_type:complete